MSAATAILQQQVHDGPPEVTLLELVQAVTDVADNESEVLAVVRHMLVSGSVRLRGNFRGVRPSVFL